MQIKNIHCLFHLVIIFFLLFISSCESKSESENIKKITLPKKWGDKIDDGNNEFDKLVVLEGEEIFSDIPDFKDKEIGKVLKLVDNSYLFIDQSEINVIHYKDGKQEQITSFGRGPTECTSIDDIGYYKNGFYILGDFGEKIIYFDYYDNEANFIESCILERRINRIAHVDNIIINVAREFSRIKENEYFIHIYENEMKEENLIKQISKNPGKELFKLLIENYIPYSFVYPDNKNLLFYVGSEDSIYLYCFDLEGNIKNRISIIDPKINWQPAKGTDKDPITMTYTDIAVDNNGFVFLGGQEYVCINDNMDNTKKNRVFVLDESGNLINVLIIDIRPTFISVSSNNTLIVSGGPRDNRVFEYDYSFIFD